MATLKSLIGMRFGRLEVISRAAENTKAGKARWNCRCDCGNQSAVIGAKLASGWTRSCGCMHLEVRARIGDAKRTHGQSKKTRTYSIWHGMLARCKAESAKKNPYYRGAGIDVCQRWESFENFFADMGECPTGMSIDRIDGKKNYEPGNCRWATRIEQNRNAKSNRLIAAHGLLLCAAEWAEVTGTPAPTIYDRLNRGWDGPDAIYGKNSTR